MKRKTLVLTLSLVLALVVCLSASAVALAATIGITAEGKEIAISVSPTSYDFGLVAESEVKATGLTYFTLSNDGNVQVDTQIQGAALSGTGATDWALGAAAGADTYALKAGTAAAYDITVATSATDFVIDLAVSGTEDFGLQFTAPTSITDTNDQKSGDTTISAVEG